MAINDDGYEGEKKARIYLKSLGLYNIQQIDWLVKTEVGYIMIEAKSRELYSPPPFWGTGLDLAQYERRKQIYEDLGIDTMLLTFEKNNRNVYHAFLSELIKTDYFTTKNQILIFNIENFTKGEL